MNALCFEYVSTAHNLTVSRSPHITVFNAQFIFVVSIANRSTCCCDISVFVDLRQHFDCIGCSTNLYAAAITSCSKHSWSRSCSVKELARVNPNSDQFKRFIMCATDREKLRTAPMVEKPSRTPPTNKCLLLFEAFRWHAILLNIIFNWEVQSESYYSTYGCITCLRERLSRAWRRSGVTSLAFIVLHIKHSTAACNTHSTVNIKSKMEGWTTTDWYLRDLSDQSSVERFVVWRL